MGNPLNTKQGGKQEPASNSKGRDRAGVDKLKKNTLAQKVLPPAQPPATTPAATAPEPKKATAPLVPPRAFIPDKETPRGRLLARAAEQKAQKKGGDHKS